MLFEEKPSGWIYTTTNTTIDFLQMKLKTCSQKFIIIILTKICRFYKPSFGRGYVLLFVNYKFLIVVHFYLISSGSLSDVVTVTVAWKNQSLLIFAFVCSIREKGCLEKLNNSLRLHRSELGILAHL